MDNVIAEMQARIVQMETAFQERITALQTVVQAQQNRPRNKPLPTLTFSNGKDEDWPTFRRGFEHMRRFQQYTEEEAKTCLAYCIRGTAARIIDDIDPRDVNISLRDLMQLYEARFMPASASAIARAEFEQAQQQPKEQIMVFHGRLRDLWKRAYPEMARNNVRGADALIVRKFAMGLRSEDVRDEVLGTPNLTYEAALEIAQNKHSVWVATTTATMGGNPDVKLDAMEIGAIGPANKGTGACYNCGSRNHLIRECPKPRQRPGNQTTQQGSGYKGKGYDNKTKGNQNRPGVWKKFPRKMHQAIAAMHEALGEVEDEEEDGETEEEVAQDGGEDGGQEESTETDFQ